MSEDLRPDLCVIGAGSGGLSVAAIAASFGVTAVLVERGRMGGDCLNVGCVPSKALIAAADCAHAMRTADRFGIGAVEPAVTMAAVRDHVNLGAEVLIGMGAVVVSDVEAGRRVLGVPAR